MLHLLPIRLALQAAAALAGLAVIAAVYAGAVGTGNALKDVGSVIRWSSSIAAVLVVLLYASWRWITPFQLYIFPYLGGRWSGVLNFTYRGKPGQRDVKMEIKHTPFGLRLLMDTAEASSSTIVVHADRNPDFQRYRLFYVFVNERKEGVDGAWATIVVSLCYVSSGVQILSCSGIILPRRGTPARCTLSGMSVIRGGSCGGKAMTFHAGSKSIRTYSPMSPPERSHTGLPRVGRKLGSLSQNVACKRCRTFPHAWAFYPVTGHFASDDRLPHQRRACT